MNEKLLASREKYRNIDKKPRENIPENKIAEFLARFKSYMGDLIILHVNLLSNYKQTSDIFVEFRKNVD